VPVDLYPAYRPARRSLRMLSRDGRPLKRQYFSEGSERPLDWTDIVRGFEVEKGQFVVVDDDELERLAPDRSRDIDLRVFVDAVDIDPVYFERAYYLAPAGESTKAYRLLATVMEEGGRAGIATFVMRGKEYLTAILSEKGILRAETLRFADEVRTPADIGLPAPETPEPGEVKRIVTQIQKLASKSFDPDDLTDPTTEELRKLVQKKLRAGDDVVDAPPEEEGEDADGSDVIDLVERLRRSLAGDGAGNETRTTKRSGTSARKTRSASGAAGELGERTRVELYERARTLGIEGRSSMSKEELIDAIARSA
jgi:DNA end-binding protein Ku